MRFLDKFNNNGEKKFMHFDSFCESPENHLKRICSFLDLSWYPEALSKAGHASQHSFGGNAGVQSKLHTTAPISIDPLEDVVLPPEHVSKIAADQCVAQIYQRLLSQYNSDFNIVSDKSSQSSVSA